MAAAQAQSMVYGLRNTTTCPFTIMHLRPALQLHPDEMKTVMESIIVVFYVYGPILKSRKERELGL
mgnify:CR=1 FL=1